MGASELLNKDDNSMEEQFRNALNENNFRIKVSQQPSGEVLFRSPEGPLIFTDMNIKALELFINALIIMTDNVEEKE